MKEDLRKFAKELFESYNSEGSRTATNIEEISISDREAVYHYDYTSLNGTSRRLSKKFTVDQDGNISHGGPIEVD